MKIYAKQVPPEYQDSSWMIHDDFYKENIVLLRNRCFREYGKHIDDFKRAMVNCNYRGWEKVKLLFQLYTGKIWKRIKIRGCTEDEWQTCLYCPAEISIDELHSFESYYFNTGTAYDIYVGNPHNNLDSTIYCTSFSHKYEIAKNYDYYSVEEKDVVIYEFIGYKKIPQYKLVK